MALNDVGVTPDQVVDLTDDALVNGIDVQLQSSVSYLDSRSGARRAAWAVPFMELPEAA
jgi:hypothetical protein